MADSSCSLFVLDHPPLLETCGFGFVSTHQLGATNTSTFSVQLDPRRFALDTLPADSATVKALPILPDNAPPLTGTVVRQRFWRTTEPPQKLTSTQKVVQTRVFNSSVSQLQTLKGAVSATVGGQFAGISAEVTASVEAGIENQVTFTAESIEEREVTLDGGKAYAFWELVESVQMTLDFYNTPSTIDLGSGALPFVWQPDPVFGTSVIAVFQDEATFDELPKE
jgi:hypothetical protein